VLLRLEGLKKPEKPEKALVAKASLAFPAF
jgi:hypothetical protein